MSSTDSTDMERVVIKLGGSVLRDEDDYAHQARRIAAFAEGLNRVYVVLSARKGHTDELIEDQAATPHEREGLKRLLKDFRVPFYAKRFDNSTIAHNLLEGEIESARRFKRQLARLGYTPASVIQGENFPIIANNSYLYAEVHSQAEDVLEGIESNIVVVPGFGAQNECGERVLLGRNASDYVAALIASVDPSVREVIYLKDVDGIIEGIGTPDARLLPEINVADFLSRGFEQVLDRRCLEYTDMHNIRIQNCKSDIGTGGTVVKPS